MNKFIILVIRAIFGVIFGFLLIRFFYPGAGPLHAVGLGIFLVGMSYVTEYWRNRKSTENRDLQN